MSSTKLASDYYLDSLRAYHLGMSLDEFRRQRAKLLEQAAFLKRKGFGRKEKEDASK